MTKEEMILEYIGCKTILEVNGLTNVIDEIIDRYADQQNKLIKSELEQTTLIAKTKIKQVEVLKEEIRILKIQLKHL